ncbi:MAG: DUF4325 domain-containing protein [Deltaproteobacteria bacterium]|nr:DUF4325 domain-containing protein [Deltaproteobacteria bacterium]
MKYKNIKLTSLVPKTITRQRGAEASSKLWPMLLKGEWIELDLSDAETVSSSFLDEIVIQSSRKSVLNHLLFVINSTENQKKLERVFSIRELPGKYRWYNDETIRDIETAPFIREEPVDEIKKAS